MLGGSIALMLAVFWEQAPAVVCEPMKIDVANDPARNVGDTLIIDQASGDRLAIVSVETTQGPCAALVDGYVVGQIRLRNGVVIDRGQDGVIATRAVEQSVFNIRTPPSVVPDVPRAKFGGVAIVGYSRGPTGLITRYLGLWHEGGGALIATFEVAEGHASKLKPVLRSRVPVRGVGFFPSPDTSSGLIGLVQDTSPTVRLVTLEWNHAEWF